MGGSAGGGLMGPGTGGAGGGSPTGGGGGSPTGGGAGGWMGDAGGCPGGGGVVCRSMGSDLFLSWRVRGRGRVGCRGCGHKGDAAVGLEDGPLDLAQLRQA